MKYFQLFREIPTEDVLRDFLGCYNISSFEETREFTKDDLVNYKTVDKLRNMTNVLERYYVPCKAKVYLRNITEKRAITILWQVLRLYGKKLIRKERFLNKKKEICYHVQHKNEEKVVIINSGTNTVTF